MIFGRLLHDRAAALTPSQRKVIDFILAHEGEAVFLTVPEIAARAGVSIASVVRAAKSLGFEGFADFQHELRNLFREKLTTSARLKKSAVSGDDGGIMRAIVASDIDNLHETMRRNNPADFRRFVEALDRAGRIVIIGLRSAHSLAVFLAVALEFLQREVLLLQPGIGTFWDRLFRLKETDALVGIGFPRYTRETVQALEYCRSRGLCTLAITDSPISPLARHADFVLTAACRMDSFMESFTAPLSLINAVVTSLGLKNRAITLEGLNSLEAFWRERRVYWEP